jgi:hypothetical protein
MELHTLGMRSQYAMVVALVPPLSRGSQRRGSARSPALEVEMVPARELVSTASAYGAAVPRELGPEHRSWVAHHEVMNDPGPSLRCRDRSELTPRRSSHGSNDAARTG